MPKGRATRAVDAKPRPSLPTVTSTSEFPYLWRNSRTGKSTLRIAFGGEVSDHDPLASLDRGIVGTHWMTRAALAAAPQRLRSPLVLRCIDDHLAGQRLPLDAIAHLDLHAAVHMRAVKVG